MSFLFKNLRLLDPNWKEARGGYEVLVEGDTIKEVSAKPIKAAKAAGDRLRQAHADAGPDRLPRAHAIHSEVNINRMEAVPLTLMMARSAGRLKRMLDRGFTTVRDTGGADWGTKTAVESGHDPRPAAVHLRPLDRPDRRPQRSATGAPTFGPRVPLLQRHAYSSAASPTAPDEVRKAAREQMRQGADQVKIMMSGGVASPYDPLDSLQFTDGGDHRRGRGGDTPSAATSAPMPIRPKRSPAPRKCGVRTIEHGNLIDDADRQADGAKKACTWCRTSSPMTP